MTFTRGPRHVEAVRRRRRRCRHADRRGGGRAFEDGIAAYDRGDYATALRLWQPLAEEGDPYAQNNLGFMYAEGDGVPLDHIKAARWYRLAAEHRSGRHGNHLSGMDARARSTAMFR